MPIDGVSDALTGLSKLAGGPLANDASRRARLASGGYLGTAIATAAIGLATAVWQVAFLRAIAWISRGLRSPARDMLLTSLASRDAYGRAFGVERAGDNAGAIIGPLAASGLVAWLGVRHAILLAIVPGVLAALSVTIAAREARRTVGDKSARRTLSMNLRELSRAGLGRVLAPVALFELRGSGFGVLGLTQAIGDLGATVVAGLLWSLVSPVLAFTYLAAWMAASVLTSRLFPPVRPASDGSET